MIICLARSRNKVCFSVASSCQSHVDLILPHNQLFVKLALALIDG